MEAPDNLRDLFHWREGAGVVDEWLRKALAFPEELGEQVQSPAWGLWTFPLLDSAFCRTLVWLSDNVGQYDGDPTDPYRGKELDLAMIKPIFDVLSKVVVGYVSPICEMCFDGYSVESIVKAFVLRYSADTQRSMGLHFDAMSDVSLTVALNHDFRGGGLRFPRYDWDTRGLRTGEAVMFPGKVTHRHEGVELEDGVRHVLVLWLKGGL